MIWEALRRDLWPEGADDHATEIAAFFAGSLDEPVAVLVAESVKGKIVGFAELSIRSDVAGLEGKRAGYVPPEFRHQGIANKLLQASRNWARDHRCVAFASDRAGRVVINKNF